MLESSTRWFGKINDCFDSKEEECEMNILFEIKMSKPYRFLKSLYYYIFKYRRRNKEIFNNAEGLNSNYSHLRKYRDLHFGKRCFIVATGPSLTTEDLELIKNEYTIGVNALCKKFPEMGWKTTYFVISDAEAYNKLKPFLNEQNISFFGGHSDEIGDKNCIVIPKDIHNNYMWRNSKKVFWKNIEIAVGNGNTVVLNAIQIAAYMGFKEIYLLGTDCNYRLKSEKLYFVDHGIRSSVQYSAGIRMIEDYKAIKRFTDAWGIKVFNATRGGMLEVFERVDLSRVLNVREKS